jgi:hypothetical protein
MNKKEKERVLHCTDFVACSVYKLYLITVDHYEGYGVNNEFYVMAKDPGDAERILLDLFEQNKIYDCNVVNIKLLAKQVYNSAVGCGTRVNPDGSDKTIPYLTDSGNCRFVF